MYNWHAKVHKSGTKVAVFNGTKLVKLVESSKDTFEPIEAQKFAEDLVEELQTRTSAQMKEPNAQPSVSTNEELQSDSMDAVKTQAKGKNAKKKDDDDDSASKDAPEEEEVEVAVIPDDDDDEDDEEKIASLTSTISKLKRSLVQERNDRIIERKARRGLAIAKQLVSAGTIEDNYDTIKEKIAQIVKLEDSEIDRLERKVAGESEFETIEDAQKELRRQSRIARLNRQASAEAQDDGDESEAESLDFKAAEAEAKVSHIDQVIEEMSKIAKEESPAEEAKETPAEEAKETPAEEADEHPAKEAASKEETEEKPEAKEKPAEEATEEKKEEASNDSSKKLAELARSYRMIASNHRKLAEAAEAEGDVATADAQDAMGDEAEEKAEDIEKKLACGDTPVEEKQDEPEAPAEEEKEEKKESAKKEPGNTVTSSKHTPLKRDDGSVIEESSFGVDKNASLVEQNDYIGDSEVEVLSRMWRGAPQDEE